MPALTSDTVTTAMDETTFARIPLADRMRPQTLSEMVGQAHLLSPDAPFRKQIASGQIRSMLFWGPPGSGKTTLALIIAKELGHHFITLSAVFSGVKDIRNAAATAREIWEKEKRKTLLFVDEIHRFSKSQQDAFLPYVEDGTMILIGATTENPSFEVIAPLRSRARVIVLKALSPEDIQSLLRRALDDVSRGMARFKPVVDRQILTYLSEVCDGDARIALNLLEGLVMATPPNEEGERVLDPDAAREAIRRETLLYDKAGEEHYNLISAFHKSLRGSDPDAALYWLARMLAAGEDPHYVARRMVRFASEDIGNADPQAISVALNALSAFDFLGKPEGELALAQAALYLATAPKSNAVYRAFGEALADVRKFGSLPVPMHIRNAPTKLMKELGYGKGYRYAHDHPDAIVEQEHLPAELKDRIYYQPTTRGYERTIKERLDKWRKILAQRRSARSR